MRPTAHKHAFCIGCGYCLAGQTHRCPECGRRFDPADLFSYAPPPPVRWGWVVYAMAALLILLALVIVAAMLA